MGEHGIEPVKSASGINLMSMNLLLEHDDDPVVWRGAMVAGVIGQFITEVCWGDLDYLVVDLPPGTGDAPLTILQSLRVSGALIVTTPQSLSNMVVRKGIKMLEMMNIPTLGVAQNMSYLRCDHCDHRMDVFGKSNAEETCKQFNVPLLGEFPLDPGLSELGDAGTIEEYDGEVMTILTEACDSLLKRVAEAENAGGSK